MNPYQPISSTSDGTEVYLKPLNHAQIKEVQQQVDGWMTLVLYDEQSKLNQPNAAGSPCSYVPTPALHSSNPRQPPFNQIHADVSAGSFFNGGPQANPLDQIHIDDDAWSLFGDELQTNTFDPNSIDEIVESLYNNRSQPNIFDPNFIDEAAKPLSNDNPQRIQFDQTEVDDIVMSTFDSNSQSNSSVYGGLYYEENPLPGYYLGATEVSHAVCNNPTECTLDFDLLSPSSMKKSMKKKSKPTRSASPPPPPNTNEWLITDESGRRRRPLLHEFLRQLLDNRRYSNIATYVNKSQGIFKIHRRDVAASLWKHVKGRNSDSEMTYDKLARGIRYYYSSGIIQQTPGRFTFQFGLASGFGTHWMPAY